jgi:uncharacterized membrane protein YgcG
MSMLDRRRSEFGAQANVRPNDVSVPYTSLRIFQIASVCLIVLGTVCLSALALYFAVVRPLKAEIAILHADNQAMKAELEKMKVSLATAQVKLAKVDGIQDSLTRIEKQLREMQEQFRFFERRISQRNSVPWPQADYSLAGVGGGGSSGGGGAGLLLLLLILGGLGALAGGSSKN